MQKKNKAKNPVKRMNAKLDLYHNPLSIPYTVKECWGIFLLALFGDDEYGSICIVL
jgi:hypothetical protein